jgi:trehalose utilization protein
MTFFRKWLDDFVVVYIDDILIYNNSMEEHVEHFQKVFQRLKKTNCTLSLRNANLGWQKWISFDIGSPKKA